MGYGCDFCGPGFGPGFVGPANVGPGCGRPGFGWAFALLIVLFILLIIIGASFFNGYGGDGC
ncbi:YjcZ family sporulation protein [Psychrobacillus sp. NPDC096426]|uniref:YjcZ family sporulation protein n=1 Tax=Psychrobacillus sp. NPDC096426 TaxID=3364491 RepID=UPI0037F59E94